MRHMRTQTIPVKGRSHLPLDGARGRREEVRILHAEIRNDETNERSFRQRPRRFRQKLLFQVLQNVLARARLGPSRAEMPSLIVCVIFGGFIVLLFFLNILWLRFLFFSISFLGLGQDTLFIVAVCSFVRFHHVIASPRPLRCVLASPHAGVSVRPINLNL